MKVDILGVEYTLLKLSKKECPKLEMCDGFCDPSVKKIVILDCSIFKDDKESIENLEYYEKEVMRNEIIHAFMYESGLWNNSKTTDSWATNEEMTDWMAIQFPKIYKVFMQVSSLLIFQITANKYY